MIRLRSRSVLIIVVSGLLALFIPTSAIAQTRPGQVITVQASSSHSTLAVLRTWKLQRDGRYTQVFPPFVAFVGVHGVGPTREGLGRTPVGVFTMTQAFGNQANNGTAMPYFRAGPEDWWDENPSSANYNRHVRSRSSPGGNSENLYYAGAAYEHAVVINYNTTPVVKGAGSGFFLHVSLGAPTQGCVALPADELNRVMRWLLPSQHPVMSIGVGDTTMSLVSPRG